MSNPLPITVGITGASGALLGFRLVKHLLELNQAVELILSEKSIPVIQQETGFTPGSADKRIEHLLSFLSLASEKKKLLRWYGNHELGAPPASGTHLTGGMVVAPCSMSTLAKIATGLSDSLITRAADVVLKERRRLILLPRETPLNAVHLANMQTLAQLDVRLIPPMLAFYSQSFQSMEGQLDYTLGKVLDHLGIQHTIYERWTGL